MADTDITQALISYGLVSDANKTQLTEWFNSMFTEIQTGGGGELLSSSIVGRTFAFGKGLTVQESFEMCGRALRVLNGRAASQTVKRF